MTVLAAAAAFLWYLSWHDSPTPLSAPGEKTVSLGGEAPSGGPSGRPPEYAAIEEKEVRPSPPQESGTHDMPGEPTGRGAAGIMEKAVGAFNSGDYETALGLFREAAEGDGKALAGMGLSCYKLGDFRLAVQYLEEFLGQRHLGEDGEEFLARKFLALAYYRIDDLDKSTEHAELALELKKDPELEDFLGRLSSERKAQSNRVDEETLHFKAIFDGYEHGGVSRTVLDILEEAYGSIGREMDYFPERPVTVVLYTEKDFYDITRLPAYAAGAYDGKIRLPVRGLEDQSRESMRHVLFHEYVHALVHSITPRAPLWINEGLAEYLVPRDFEKVRQVIPLTALEASFPMDDQRATTLAYMESFSAVSYLVERYGMYGLKELLLALSRGEELDQAFYSAFYITYGEFVSTWGKD